MHSARGRMKKAMAKVPGWLPAIRAYLVWVGVGNLVWETLQLPLYTLWRTGTPREIAVAALHCTGGDVVIAATALMTALVLVGKPAWPAKRFLAVASVAVVLGLAYTIFSEWMNTTIRRTWAYSELMPMVPWTAIGLSPMLQWLVLPAFSLFGMWRAACR